MKRFLNILKKVGPWVVAVVIFTWLFKEYKPAQIWMAVKQANMLYFLGIAISYFILMYIVDCGTMSKILTRFGYPVRVRDIFPARGVTYLIMNINYPAAQAAFAYYLKRTHSVPIFEVLGIFFFIAIIDLYVLLTIAFLGSFFQAASVGGVSIGPYIRVFVACAYVLLLLHLVFWRGWFSRVIRFKRKVKASEWIRSKKIFCVFNDAKIIDYLKVAAMRSPIHITIVLFLYVAIRAFDAHVPLIYVIGSVPIAFLIGTIPITPGGIGTSNAALIEFLSPHLTGSIIDSGMVSPQGLILAVTLLWMVTNLVLKSVVAFACLQKVSKKLFKPMEQAS